MPSHVRVAIIGSGFAGLGMAIQLTRHDISLHSERAATLMPHASFRALPGRTRGTALRPAAEVLDAVIPFLAALDA